VSTIYERAGASLRRAPYVWLALTILLYLMLATPAAEIDTPPRDANTVIAIAAAAVIAYSVVASLWIVPRVLVPRVRAKRSDNQIAALRWAFAAVPVTVSFGAIAIGGQPWVFTLGFVVSVALTAQTARDLNRGGRLVGPSERDI
jgi:hypothetical protein